jgi:MFS family permease
MSMPFMNSFWIARTNNYNRGEYAALYTMSWSAAQILAPAMGSQVIYYGGFKSLWWLLGILSALNSRRILFALQNNKTPIETVPAKRLRHCPNNYPKLHL